MHLHSAAAGLALKEFRLRLVDVDLELLLVVVVLVVQHALRHEDAERQGTALVQVSWLEKCMASPAQQGKTDVCAAQELCKESMSCTR